MSPFRNTQISILTAAIDRMNEFQRQIDILKGAAKQGMASHPLNFAALQVVADATESSSGSISNHGSPSRASQDPVCRLCNEQKANTIYRPCMHSNLCKRCVCKLGDSLKACIECTHPVNSVAEVTVLSEMSGTPQADVKSQCVLCDSSAEKVQFNPCGHSLYCAKCTAQHKNCPMCLTPISSRFPAPMAQ